MPPASELKTSLALSSSFEKVYAPVSVKLFAKRRLTSSCAA
jgi:hypothetical protein